jgi:hypothetical protein
VVKNIVSLQKMQVVSWLYLAVLTCVSWVAFSWTVAWSVLAGGIIAILSFWVSHRELMGFLNSIATSPEVTEGQAKSRFGKSGYLFRFWFRIAIIGVVVFGLIKISSINTFGLILGLSTIVFTVTFTAVDIVRHYYFSGRR